MKKLAVACALLALAACGGKQDAEGDSGAIAVEVQPARTMPSIRDSMTGTGVITPTAAADFLVTAPEAAEIAELTKNEGDAVKAGEILVRFEIPAVAAEVAARQLELADATTRVDRAKAEADRLGKLFEQGLTARNQWEAARAAHTQAETALLQARSRFDTAKGLENNSIIRARFSGVVAKRFHVQGDLVAGGDQDPVMRIVDPTQLQIVAQFPVGGSTRIVPGQIASVINPVDPVPQTATVSMRAPQASPAATTVDVKLNFVAPTTWPIDTAVQVDLVLEERKDAIVVPTDALVRAEGLVYVWLPTSTNQATRRQVQTGLVAGTMTQIVSGVAAGEAVIVKGIAELTEGALIIVR